MAVSQLSRRRDVRDVDRADTTAQIRERQLIVNIDATIKKARAGYIMGIHTRLTREFPRVPMHNALRNSC